MSDLINKQFIQYKNGFIDGKWTAIDVFYSGKIMRFQTGEKVPEMLKGWYKLGFLDGFAYFNDLIVEEKLCLEKVDTNKIQRELFAKKIEKLSKQEDKGLLKVKSIK